MNETMIENWNKVVSDDSIVFHLGDVAWGRNWKQFMDRLKGHKILIIGNHENKNLPSENNLNGLFEDISTQYFCSIEGRQVLLNHYPFLCYSGTYRNADQQVWALHGHIHFGPTSLSGLDVQRMKYLFPTQYDVGVDMNNFTPISWNELKQKIEFQVSENKNMYEIIYENINNT